MNENYFDEIFAEAKENFINGNYKVAEPILTQMILQNTKNPEVYQMLATLYYDKGQFNKAIKTFKRALEIDPSYTDASIGLSIILNDLGRYEEGKQIFLEAQQLLDRKKSASDPWLEEKLSAKHLELADLYFQYKRYSESLEQLQKAHQLSHRKSEIGLRIGEVFMKMGDSHQAIKQLRQVIKEQPNLLAARVKLGLIYYHLGDMAAASDQWETVLMRDPEHAEAMKYLRQVQTHGVTSVDL